MSTTRSDGVPAKKIIVLGVLTLLLLGAMLRRTATNLPPRGEGKPASAESPTISQIIDVRDVPFQRITAREPIQPGHDTYIEEGREDPDFRSETLERAVESVSDTDLPDRLASLVSETSPAMVELREMLVRRWAESDSPAAAAWTAQLPQGSVYQAALKQVTVAWANADLAGAVNWMRTLPDGESKPAAILALAYEAARTEPMTALILASELQPSRERDDLLVHAVSQWAETDAPTAAAWAAAVVDPRVRQSLIVAVVISLAGQDGAAAATLTATALAAGNDQDRAVASVVQIWAQHSPQAAACWVSAFPGTPARDAAAQNLVALWEAQDSQGVQNWLRELPAGSLRDVGFIAYAHALVDRDRASATARTVEDDLQSNGRYERNPRP